MRTLALTFCTLRKAFKIQMDGECPCSIPPLNFVRKEDLFKFLACRRRYKIKCKKNFGIKRSRKHDLSLGNVSSLLSDSLFTHTHTKKY